MNESVPTVGELLRDAELRLAVTSPSARLDSEVLLAFALGVSRTSVLTSLRERCSEEAAGVFATYVGRRSAGEPVAYITGEREFWGLSFIVTPDVLVPRPETELVVEEALRALRATSAPRVLDLGTGSGCIGISIAHELASRGARDFLCTLVDISPEALAIAKQNVARHGVADRVDLVRSSWLDNEAELQPPYDLIVANPPYVSRSEKVSPELAHEPQGALYSEDDGLRDTKIIIESARRFLTSGGTILIEVGAGKRSLLQQYASEMSALVTIEFLGDNSPDDRFTVLRCTYQ